MRTPAWQRRASDVPQRRVTGRTAACLAAILLAAGVGGVVPAAAQSWHADASAGRIRSALVDATAESFAAALRYDAPATSFRISAGLPVETDAPQWAGASAWKRFQLGHRGLTAGLDLAGNAFVTRDRATQERQVPGPFQPPAAPAEDNSGWAAAGQVAPVLALRRGSMELQARAGLSHYAARTGDRALDHSVALADLQLTLEPTGSLALVPTVRYYRPVGQPADSNSGVTNSDDALYAGATVFAVLPLADIWGSAGTWTGEDRTYPWSAGARLFPRRRISIEATVRDDTRDPLYLQPAQTSWSVGMSVRLGPPPASAQPPVPSAYVNGRATVVLKGSDARGRPSIAGDFNGWNPAPMTASADDWSYVVPVAPGVYNYAFVSDDGEWFVPKNTPGRRDDGMGGHVAVLVVR